MFYFDLRESVTKSFLTITWITYRITTSLTPDSRFQQCTPKSMVRKQVSSTKYVQIYQALYFIWIRCLFEVQISIGHVKGYILPDLRNIYCTSGVIHLIDTVLVAPLRNAYQQIALYPQLR